MPLYRKKKCSLAVCCLRLFFEVYETAGIFIASHAPVNILLADKAYICRCMAILNGSEIGEDKG
jgi:hypothetical protein